MSANLFAYRGLRDALPADCTLVAVSKFQPVEAIEALYAAGHRDFGENRVQELAAKAAALPKDIRWHMIGRIQTNKIREFAPFVHLVHSVDRLEVLRVLQNEALRAGRRIDVLLQVHIAREETKAGFSPDEVLGLCAVNVLNEYPNLRVVGLMGMASFTEDRDLVRAEFALLSSLFRAAREQLGVGQVTVLSMGMSGDYELALTEGANHIRVGSLLFGARSGQ
ncbi:MAG: YggS family pyridoxal phosphate-dependent enzyme [Bacteroidetes bacterium]|nr:YggS family pyridoxal phosphate-dependent enzyme [Bacteroidota bacterium]